MSVWISIILIINLAAIVYILLVGYDGLAKLALSLFRLADYAEALQNSPRKRQFSSDSYMPISLILPDCDKDSDVVQMVEDLYELDYPEYEIIAICNSSRSESLNKLKEAFSMVEIHQPIKRSVPMGEVQAVYRSPKHMNLIVLDRKDMARHDALNAGINVSRYPLFVILGVGYRLEKNALTHISASFSRSYSVVAAGSLPRIRQKGRSLSALDSLQETEYLRTFPAGLTVPGQRRLSVIPGTFGAFRKQTVITEGGFIPSGSEIEMVVRLSRDTTKQRQRHEIDMLPNPVFASDPPNNFPSLFRQRMQWQADTVFSLWHNRKMFFNPKYGRSGLLDAPYYWLFSVIGPLLEFIGCITIPLSFVFGLVSFDIFLIFLALELLLGTIVSLSAIVSQEILDSSAPSSERTARRILCAIINNFGYRQILLFFTNVGFLFPGIVRSKRTV